MSTFTIFFRAIVVALLIAPAMLVAPPLLVIPGILVITPLFAFACILKDKLEMNEEAAVKEEIKKRFGDVLIGIISGLVASYLMWVLLTVDKIPILLLFLVFSMLVALLAVAFSIVVIWVFFAKKLSR